MFEIYFTTAPRRYDHVDAVQLSPFVGRAEFERVRMIALEDRTIDWQRGRNSSGLYPTWTVEEWRQNVQTLPRSFEAVPPVTEFDGLDLALQERFLSVEEAGLEGLPIAGLADVFLIAIGALARVGKATVALMTVEKFSERLEDGTFRRRLFHGE